MCWPVLITSAAPAADVKEELTKSMADFGFMIIQTLVTGALCLRLHIWAVPAQALTSQLCCPHRH